VSAFTRKLRTSKIQGKLHGRKRQMDGLHLQPASSQHRFLFLLPRIFLFYMYLPFSVPLYLLSSASLRVPTFLSSSVPSFLRFSTCTYLSQLLYLYFLSLLDILFLLEDKTNIFLRYIGTYLLNYTTSHAAKQ
jgi:hypothetical protein